ncbi:uncharacterized protein UHO2_05650 [Ustilago hordei]|uniref:Integrase catalytic domain-containing protein n=1 Tax=Ustilago hordei TaxID=120017 RepID=I2FRF6_USTHO|nr:uncharacterized protein UHO2_05650 [Ustilago hordei]CCF49499.1 uncharacterized protein UHOR_07470 [Ustilago hordei]SYW76933.1 uncharacterized protein UHO2_05650 [Ustilago hordei]
MVGYNSKQNGQVERMNRSLSEKMWMLLMQRRLPKSFWLYAIQAAAFKINLTPNADSKLPYEAMFKKLLEWLILLLCIFRCLVWVNVPKAKQDNAKLDHLERKGWLFYSPEYKPTVFWSNSVKFLETKCWMDHTQWCLVNIQPLPTLTNEEDSADLGYTEENLFDEKDPDALCKYDNME